MQRVLNNYEELTQILRDNGKIFFVHGKSAENFSRLNKSLNSLSTQIVHFTDFRPNPDINDAKKANESFRMNQCVIIISAGGGSSLDVAKYVKLNNPEAKLIAIPSTAGSGSEATRFAVLYENGVKLSITDDNIIPDYVLFDPELIKSLPEYHRKSSALDAFSHALESFWSVNANEESKNFSREALQNITRMLENYPESYNYRDMLVNAYTAGKAINISQTTAGHAMCYKITGIFGTAHGHSAALCNRVLFRWLVENSDLKVLSDIALCMNCKNPKETAEKFERIYNNLGLDIPEANEKQINMLVNSVNPERLKNFPVKLDKNIIRELYCKILKVK